MIGYLTGKIISKKPTVLLLDVNGVGYLINISTNTFENLPDCGETLSLYTHLSVKEDSLTLYGFSTLAEKDMFLLLISVSGIGPKLAQSILSGIQIDGLTDALITGNVSRLIAIPGVGKKTAERLIVELRDKVESIAIELESFPSEVSAVKSDAVVALINLGYNRKIAENTVRSILSTSASISIEELIRQALTYLNK